MLPNSTGRAILELLAVINEFAPPAPRNPATMLANTLLPTGAVTDAWRYQLMLVRKPYWVVRILSLNA